jgi:hypothetical protein
MRFSWSMRPTKTKRQGGAGCGGAERGRGRRPEALEVHPQRERLHPRNAEGAKLRHPVRRRGQHQVQAAPQLDEPRADPPFEHPGRRGRQEPARHGAHVGARHVGVEEGAHPGARGIAVGEGRSARQVLASELHHRGAVRQEHLEQAALPQEKAVRVASRNAGASDLHHGAAPLAGHPVGGSGHHEEVAGDPLLVQAWALASM